MKNGSGGGENLESCQEPVASKAEPWGLLLPWFLVWLSRLAQPFPEVFLPALRQFFHSQGHGGGDAKGSGGTRAFLEVLNVKAEGSGDEYTGEQEGAGAHQAVRQEPPSGGLDVRPFRILGVNEEMLVMAKNVGDHDADDCKQNIFRARPR